MVVFAVQIFTGTSEDSCMLYMTGEVLGERVAITDADPVVQSTPVLW